MRNTIIALLLAAIPFAAGASEQEEAAVMAAVAALMKDPDSVQFRNVQTVVYNTEVGRSAYVCGEFNAKNSYGGYVGYRRFFKSATLATGRSSTAPILESQSDGLDESFYLVYDLFCLGKGIRVAPTFE